MLRLRKEILKTAVKEDKGFSFGGCSEITDAELSSLSEDITGKTDDNDIVLGWKLWRCTELSIKIGRPNITLKRCSPAGLRLHDKLTDGMEGRI
ncbi:hypothetical protein EMCRGX_G010569 [Ephydatia muelleri]